MDIFSSKRAEALTIILIVIIVAVFLGWVISFTSKECRSNSDCGSDFYCGSDFSCHQMPVIEKTIVKNNFLFPSVIIGVAIVIAAIILKSEKIHFRRKFQPRIGPETDEEMTQDTYLKTP